MKDALLVSALSVVPRNAGARTMGRFARTRLSRWVTRAFVRAYRVDLSEAEGDLADYPSLEALFTRRLLPGARPVDASPHALTSPVDGKCAGIGRSVDGTFQMNENQAIVLEELLGEAVSGERDVAVLYLSPRDYHRVHAPCEGALIRWAYVPGTLWPVFPAAVRRVPKLFTKNERAVVTMETPTGPLQVVLVGAFGVGRITLSGCDLVTNAGGAAAKGSFAEGAALGRGEELGVFHLGSTVVLVAPPGRFAFSVAVGDSVRMGQRMGQGMADG